MNQQQRPPLDNAPCNLPMREESVVMSLERLGCYHQTRLSFMRTLIRIIMREKWVIETTIFDLDKQGYGTVVYEVQAKNGLYSFVLFSNYLAPEIRNDRVIADQWDLTMALCEGRVDARQLEQLRENVPKQEAGRLDSRVIVLSRANRSARNFDYMVDCLASGKQPAVDNIARIGYLYRTTAVYGSGKFGMADWEKVRQKYTDFARPFAAEMFTCYMLRSFSLLQVQHIAHARAPKVAVAMDVRIQRYFGIGNSTGLGMAPFLINHPILVSRWIEVRETALARVVHHGEVNAGRVDQLRAMVAKVIVHHQEITADDAQQAINNAQLIEDMKAFSRWLAQCQYTLSHWSVLQRYAQQQWGMETQEVINALLLELYPDVVDPLEEQMCAQERFDLQPDMPLAEFKKIIEQRYQWALAIDFSLQDTQQVFWYRSEEKMEPRLGECGVDKGKDKEIDLAVARAVRECYEIITVCMETLNHQTLSDMLLEYPVLKGIARRIQTMAQYRYGDIQGNLVDKNVLPIHLLRCKLSFFGVSKFDPRSRLWVRNTMFQGAPLLSDIGKPFNDDWYFPIAPTLESSADNSQKVNL